MEDQRRGSAWPSRRILLGSSLCNVIVILDITVVNVAVDSIRVSLHANVAELQWIISAYTLVFAALLLSGGALCDRWGARRPFVAGVVVFTLGSAACGVSEAVTTLIAARALQGIGAAICVPASLTLLTDTYPDGAGRARAISIWGGIGGLSVAAGPIVGGALIDLAGWPSVFFINVPFGLLAVALTWGQTDCSRRARARRLDAPGQILAVPVLAGVTYACIASGTAGWGDSWVLAGLACSAIAVPAFVMVERASAEPMLPLELFRSRATNAGILAGFALNFSYYGLLFALSLFFQSERHYSPTRTGLTFLPMTVLAVFVNLLAGSLIARFGSRPPLVSGLLLAVAGFLSLTFMTNSTPFSWIVGPMLAIGVGSALGLPAFTVAVMGSVEREFRGVASGVLNASRQAGGVLGVGIFGSFVAGGRFVAGLHAAVLVAAALLLVAAAGSALFIGRRPTGARASVSTCAKIESNGVSDVVLADLPEPWSAATLRGWTRSRLDDVGSDLGRPPS